MTTHKRAVRALLRAAAVCWANARWFVARGEAEAAKREEEAAEEYEASVDVLRAAMGEPVGCRLMGTTEKAAEKADVDEWGERPA